MGAATRETLPPPPSLKTVSAVVCAVLGSLLVIAAFALPNLIEARKNGNEVSAIGSLKTIATAQSLFREGDLEGDGNLDYGTLAELGQAGLIDATLASGRYKGYLFEATYASQTSEFLWFATANPIDPGRTGDRAFCSNHEGVTFYTVGSPVRLNGEDCQVSPLMGGGHSHS